MSERASVHPLHQRKVDAEEHPVWTGRQVTWLYGHDNIRVQDVSDLHGDCVHIWLGRDWQLITSTQFAQHLRRALNEALAGSGGGRLQEHPAEGEAP